MPRLRPEGAMPDPAVVKRKLLRYREQHSLSQRAMAQLLSCSPGLVGEMEREKLRSLPAALKVMELEG